ncbi:OmpA family protein [Mucilaginibacter sp. SP1R1]|uniref:OmpA family protein n=1 Tax=Mucilaginibacter sp. SP1R1 TaxID=2723091 RepID=UPI00160C85DE|nr:OmpA family protein [Mucilaginibacter sp. SP1R1]MBB6151374.1 OOP family OmpA-OmpF porin [Mucilaginibacter sp. SP1R1]
MKAFKTPLFPLILALLAVSVLSCKSKKLAQKPAPVETEQTYAPKPQPAPAPAPVKKDTPPPPSPKPNYNFSNIQFEFNSAVLKTNSYQTLDQAAGEMKKDNTVKFVLNGNASAEGTPERNMELSIERANSVKLYLVNSGISGDNLTVKGYGETKPVADNSTEDGRVLNRRVEIKVNQ